MPIAFPDQPAEPERRSTGPQEAPRRPDERDRARTRAREDGAGAEGAPSAAAGAGEVVPFPGGQLAERAEPGALVVAARAWLAEAAETARGALDGSVYRARPPSLRDSVTRLQRAEWSGGIPALAWLGWIYGYPIQVIRALLMGLIWLLDHPSRLLIAGGVVVAAFYLH